MNMVMYGPNPVEKKEGKFYIQWRTGQLYAKVSLNLGKGPVVAKLKKGKIISEDYNGFDKITGAMSKKMAMYLDKEISK